MIFYFIYLNIFKVNEQNVIMSNKQNIEIIYSTSNQKTKEKLKKKENQHYN